MVQLSVLDLPPEIVLRIGRHTADLLLKDQFCPSGLKLIHICSAWRRLFLPEHYAVIRLCQPWEVITWAELLTDYPSLGRHARSVVVDWGEYTDSNIYILEGLASSPPALAEDPLHLYYDIDTDQFAPNHSLVEQYGDPHRFHESLETIFRTLIQQRAPLDELAWTSTLFGIPKYVADILIDANTLPRIFRFVITGGSFPRSWYPALLKNTKLLDLRITTGAGFAFLHGHDSNKRLQYPELETVLEGTEGPVLASNQVEEDSQAGIIYRMLAAPKHLDGLVIDPALMAFPEAVALAARTELMYDWQHAFDTHEQPFIQCLRPTDEAMARYNAARGLRSALGDRVGVSTRTISPEDVKIVLKETDYKPLIDDDRLYQTVADSFNATRSSEKRPCTSTVVLLAEGQSKLPKGDRLVEIPPLLTWRHY